MLFTKDSCFLGLTDSFPPEIRGGIEELEKRLEHFISSLMTQMRTQPTVFSYADLDEIEGMQLGDVNLNEDGVYRYDGMVWIKIAELNT